MESQTRYLVDNLFARSCRRKNFQWWEIGEKGEAKRNEKKTGKVACAVSLIQQVNINSLLSYLENSSMLARRDSPSPAIRVLAVSSQTRKTRSHWHLIIGPPEVMSQMGGVC